MIYFLLWIFSSHESALLTTMSQIDAMVMVDKGQSLNIDQILPHMSDYFTAVPRPLFPVVRNSFFTSTFAPYLKFSEILRD